MDKLKIVSNIIGTYFQKGASSPNVIAKEILDILEEAERISSKMNELEKDKRDYEKNFRKHIQEKNDEISRIQASCKHHLTTYYPDPSGNNDSSTECNICGKEV